MSDALMDSRAQRALEEPGVLAVATLYAQSFVSGAEKVGEQDAWVSLI